MRGQMKRSTVVLTALALAAACSGDAPTTVVAPTTPTFAAIDNGNSANAESCRDSGWTGYVTGTGSTFKNTGDCVSYAAQGGVLYKPQTITFAPLAAKTFGDPSFTVSATATSGLPVSFSASGNCTVIGTTVSLTGAGSCTITASQAGDAIWYMAPNVSQSFSIAKGNQTITFGVLPEKTLGDPAFVVTATATSGLTVTFVASGTCTVSGNTVSLTGVGLCTITASQAGDANWNAAPDVSRTFNVKAACSLGDPDADGDRLPNCAETGTNVYVNTLNTGTNPNNADTDGDKINDGDEVLGTVGGLNLPAMGTKPLRRDILLEYDWYDDNIEPGVCGAHSHRPSAGTIARLTASFATSPIANPDGSTGINVINDYGQSAAFTGGNLIADADGVIAGGVGDAEYTARKTANFAANRNGYFHYVLMPHRYNTDGGSSGQAEINGDDLVVSIYCFGRSEDISNVSNTIMHELGHNLGLRHGGNQNLNQKPNYNSIMNYRFQFPGIDNNCAGGGDGVLSFSVGTRPQLNENNLDERQGICGNPPGPGQDWNGDGDALDFGFSFNITTGDDGSSALDILNDYNDWANLDLAGIGDSDGSRARLFMAPEIVTCSNAPPGAR